MLRTTPLLLLISSACTHDTETLANVREPFIALERHFDGFRAWTRVELSGRPAQGNAHLAGETHEYVNYRPPHGSKTFPVGTILVKTVAGQTKTDIFAMVKRGSSFNAAGAVGWEWFGLRARPDGSLAIVWRGVNAPDGERYGGDPVGGCNGCHAAAADNDYVHASSLFRH